MSERNAIEKVSSDVKTPALQRARLILAALLSLAGVVLHLLNYVTLDWVTLVAALPLIFATMYPEIVTGLRRVRRWKGAGLEVETRPEFAELDAETEEARITGEPQDESSSVVPDSYRATSHWGKLINSSNWISQMILSLRHLEEAPLKVYLFQQRAIANTLYEMTGEELGGEPDDLLITRAREMGLLGADSTRILKKLYRAAVAALEEQDMQTEERISDLLSALRAVQAVNFEMERNFRKWVSETHPETNF